MTWSIIARDETTGRIGIAVATRFFAVGAMVPHIKTGVGAVASQAFINPHYGPQGLALLEAGLERRGDGRPPHRGRRGPPQPPAARHGPGGPVRCLHGRRLHRLVRPRAAPELLRRRQHAGGPGGARRDDPRLRGRAALPFARRLHRGDAGGRGGGRRQARQAIGGAADPRRRGLSALRPARRRPRRSAGRACAPGRRSPASAGCISAARCRAARHPPG